MQSLMELATLRQANLDKDSLKLFANRLTVYNLDDVQNALETIGNLPKQDGKTAFPEYGAIIAVIECEKLARENRERAAAKRIHVIWQCPVCLVRTSEFLPPDANLDRQCTSSYGPAAYTLDMKKRLGWTPAAGKSLDNGEVCGGIMEVILNEAA